MSEPINLVAFCGSLRKASFNRLALNAFIERLPAGVTAQTIEIDWPLYNADVQAQGFPAPVQAAQKAMLEADDGAPEAGVAGEEAGIVVDVLRHFTWAAALDWRTARTSAAPRSVSSLAPVSSVNLPSANLPGAAPIMTSGLFTNRPSRNTIICRR